MLHQPARALPACNIPVPSSSSASASDASDFDTLISESIKGLPTHRSDFQSLLDQVVKLVRILIGASGSAIAFRGERGTVCRATSGEGAPPVGASVDITSGISKQCLDSGTSLCCDDIVTQGRVDLNASRALGIRAMAVVPIYRAGEIAGILAAFSNLPGTFNDQHLEKLQRLANLIDSAANPSSEEPLRGSNVDVHINGHPDIKLLVELEPAYRAFLLNLVDLVLLPLRSPLPASSEMHGWNDVFVESHIPWKRFLQSVFLHVVVMGMLSGLSKVWPRERLVFSRSFREADVTYYPVSASFPARGSSRPAVQPKWRHALARRIVAPGYGRQPTMASGVRNTNDRPETLSLTPPPPEMPIAVLNRWQKLRLGAATSVLPAPPINERQARLLDLPNVAIVAPSPDLSGASGLGGINAPSATVVPPPPNGWGSITRTGVVNVGELGAGTTGVAEVSIVPPPPTVNEHAALTYGTAGITSNTRVKVVAPPPSIHWQGALGSRGEAIGIGGSGSDVVPPPSSIQGKGDHGGGARIGSLGVGVQVVPPPPSVQGGVEGISVGGGGNSLANGGWQVVPPAPSIGRGGNSIAGSRASSLARADAGAVLPPASTAGGASPEAGGVTVEPDVPPPSVPQVGNNPTHASFQDLRLRVVSLAMSLPRSSYFSNYEIFVAEHWLSKTESQLIKLVYVFLPYQRRMSEYGDLSKVFKVRVTRDPTCDESLMQIMWPEGESPASSQGPVEGLTSNSVDRKNLLPCYRTTADDYRRALSRSR